MAVCPNCGSDKFRYELRSAGTKSKTNYYRTGIKNSWLIPAGRKKRSSDWQQKSIGFCPDCGYMADRKEVHTTSLFSKIDKRVQIAGTIVFWVVVIALIAYAVNAGKHIEQDTAAVDSVWSTEYTPLEDFKYYIDGSEITLTDYKGHNKKINIAPVYGLDGKDYKVVALDGTFALGNLTSAIVPEGVVSIANNTFNSCGIKYLYLPSTLEKFNGWNYFHDAQKLYYGGSEEQWAALCTRDRSSIDFTQIVFDATTADLIS